MMYLCRGQRMSSLSSVQTHYYRRLLQSLLSSAGDVSNQVKAFSSERSDARSEHISLALPTFMVWGANTGVGKTLISAALAREASLKEVPSPLTIVQIACTSSEKPFQRSY